MTKFSNWLKEYRTYLGSLSNADLFEETVKALDCQDKSFTSREWWRAVESLKLLSKRLENWLEE